jgi:hypothetical protein
MNRNRPILFLLPLSLAIISCSSNRETADNFGLAGTWEVDLSQGGTVSTLKGQVVFAGNRYIYTWYQLNDDSDVQSKEWNPIEMEQGNIIVEKAGVMALLADSYGIPSRNDDAQSPDGIEYEIKPSKSDYLIHYEIENDQLVWMEDSNFDGDFDDANETFIYMRVK